MKFSFFLSLFTFTLAALSVAAYDINNDPSNFSVGRPYAKAGGGATVACAALMVKYHAKSGGDKISLGLYDKNNNWVFDIKPDRSAQTAQFYINSYLAGKTARDWFYVRMQGDLGKGKKLDLWSPGFQAANKQGLNC
ncbi:hypothetical protein T439DRAFT_40493 [Meredithblackwellia eburnea MCA 4105]